MYLVFVVVRRTLLTVSAATTVATATTDLPSQPRIGCHHVDRSRSLPPGRVWSSGFCSRQARSMNFRGHPYSWHIRGIFMAMLVALR